MINKIIELSKKEISDEELGKLVRNHIDDNVIDIHIDEILYILNVQCDSLSFIENTSEYNLYDYVSCVTDMKIELQRKSDNKIFIFREEYLKYIWKNDNSRQYVTIMGANRNKVLRGISTTN